jgi:tripartite-type tricarboxylate transporter receptor subunit TctC
MIFLPGGASADIVEAYSTALDEIMARDDFNELAAATLGVYPQMTRDAAQSAFVLGTQVDEEASAFVINWLEEATA